MARVCCQRKGGFSQVIHLVWVCAVPHKQLTKSDVALYSGEHEQGPTEFIREVDVQAAIQRFAYRGEISALDCSMCFVECHSSEVADLGWSRTPIIVATVVVAHWRCHQFVDVETLEAGDIDVEVLLAGQIGDIDPRKGMHAAVLAEEVMRYRIGASIIRQLIFAGD